MRHTRKIWLGGRATAFPFWMKIREWKGGRATWFPFSIKIRVSRWGHATLTSFFGQKSDFRAIEGEEGRATCFFGATKGRSTRAKREQNARNMRVYPAADYTAPAPFSPSLMGCMCPGCNLKVCILLYIQRDRTNLILVALFLQGPELGISWCMVLWWWMQKECGIHSQSIQVST